MHAFVKQEILFFASMCWGGKSIGFWQEINVGKKIKVCVDTSLKYSKKPIFFVIPLNQVQHNGGQTYKYINRLEMPKGQIAPFDQAHDIPLKIMLGIFL